MSEPRTFRPQQFWYPHKTKIEFHPCAEKYELLPPEELAEIVESMKANGYDSRYPIAIFDGKILDGRNRYLAAVEAKTEFLILTVPPGTDPDAYVKRANDDRRHESLEVRHARRRERVAAARANGESIRTIAESEGIDPKQVRRDLETVNTQVGTVSPPDDNEVEEMSESPADTPTVVTGRDGKTYPATKPEKPKPAETIFCRPCRTGTPKENCKDCATARKLAKNDSNGSAKPKPPPANAGDAWEEPETQPKVQPMDQLGNPVPKGLRDTFAGNAESLSNAVKLLQEVKRTVKGLMEWNAYMRPTDMETKLAELIQDCKNGLPYAVCQPCKGKGCSVCRNEGWLTKWRVAELEAK